MSFFLLLNAFLLQGQEGFFKKLNFDTTAVKAATVTGVYQALDGHLWLLNSNNELKPNDVLSTLSKVSVYIDPVSSSYLTIKGSTKNPYILAFAEGADRAKYFFIHLDDDPDLNAVNSTILLAKFDENMIQQWVVNITPKRTGIYQFATEAKVQLLILPNGDLICQYSNYQVNNQLSEKVIMSLDNNGQIKWSKTLNNVLTQDMKMVYRLPSNEIIWSGYIFNNVSSQSTVVIYHLNSANGELNKLYALEGLVSQVPISMHLTTLNRLVFLTSGNTVITTDGVGGLLWAYTYRDNEESRARMLNAIPMNGNALGIILQRFGFLGSEMLKIDLDGDVLLSRRYHSFRLTNGSIFPGFSHNEIYAPAQTQNEEGTAQLQGMVHLHEDLSVSPCEKQAFCFVKTPTNMVFFNHGNDLVNYILEPRSIILPSFEWKNLTFQSETHCVLGERPQASFSTEDTICVGEFVNFMELKNQNADSSTWQTVGGNPDKYFGKGPPKLSYLVGGNYTIRHLMKAGCLVDTFEQKIVVLENPKFNLPDSVFLCQGNKGIQNLAISNVTNYKWSDGFPSIDRTFDSEGSFILQADNQGFCQISDTVSTRSIELNTNFLTPNLLCTEDSINFLLLIQDQNPRGTEYDFLFAPPQRLKPFQNGYIGFINSGSVSITMKVSLQGCEAETTKMINVFSSSLPIPTDDTLVCSGILEIPITATNAASWKWSDNDTSSIKKIFDPGIYQYTLSNEFCESQHQLKVGFLDFSGEILADSIYCINDKKVIDFQPNQSYSNVNYDWNFSHNNQIEKYNTKSFEILFDDVGVHQLTLKAQKDDCTTQQTFNIEVVELPIIDFGRDNPSLLIDSLILLPTVMPTHATLVWNDGYPSVERIVNEPGIYAITAAISTCTTEDEIEIKRGVEVYTPNILKKGGAPMEIKLSDPNTQILEFLIFDRFGNIVYKSHGEPWDGANVVQGVYAFAIRLQFASGKEEWLHGDVTVVE